ncbi:MAG: ATP-binding cassette domain-containing protein [Candidatus Theseobacter exili]|nr:ATP-binding cassette domain-containing protein [Candidatus Theseobacter exili]
MAKDSVIAIHHVGVRYKKKGHISAKRKKYFWALRDVSMVLKHGETLGIIGRNGAGKSTLLRLMANIIKPDGGRIARREGQATLLSLQAGFDPYLTGYHNIILSGMLLGISRSGIARKMNQIISLSELGSHINELVRTYSSGMRTRLGFSAAYYADPDILLIDEVLGVGDIKFSEISSNLIHEKIKSNNTAVIVSHNIPMITQLCDRVIWIEKGKTKMTGDPQTVTEAYINSN